MLDYPPDDPLHLFPLFLSQLVVLLGTRYGLLAGVDKRLARASRGKEGVLNT